MEGQEEALREEDDDLIDRMVYAVEGDDEYSDIYDDVMLNLRNNHRFKQLADILGLFHRDAVAGVSLLGSS